jgi:hypothetical protein
LAGKMSMRIASIALAIILVLIPSFPALAEETSTGTITITMTTKTVLEIELNPTSWGIGQVELNTEYKTDPEKTWCTMTNRGNCAVNTYVKGMDAEWVDYPSQKWTLSDDKYNGENEYVLWYWVGWTSGEYILIKKAESGVGAEFCPSLDVGDTNHKKFGLKLLTPTSFYGGREMKTTITVTAVAA